jgi:hypothetical protein
MAPQQLFLPQEEGSKPLIDLLVLFGKTQERMKVEPLLTVADVKDLIRCELLWLSALLVTSFVVYLHHCRSQYGIMRAPFYLSKDLDGQPLELLKTLHEQGINNGAQIHAIMVLLILARSFTSPLTLLSDTEHPPLGFEQQAPAERA